MVYTFHIVATDPNSDPGQEYHAALKLNAELSLAALVDLPNPNGCAALRHIWQLCEYLDAVDARCLPMTKDLYRCAVERLGRFMREHTHQSTLQELTEKSWAAHTVRELVLKQERVEQQQASTAPGYVRLVA